MLVDSYENEKFYLDNIEDKQRWVEDWTAKAKELNNTIPNSMKYKIKYKVKGELAEYLKYLNLTEDELHRFGVHSTNILPDHQIVKDFKNYYHIDDFVIGRINCSVGGYHTTSHFDYELDTWKAYPGKFDTFLKKDMEHYLIFLTDWQVGQSFTVGNKTVTKWKVGTVISWPWFALHHGQNNSVHNRWAIHFGVYKGIK